MATAESVKGKIQGLIDSANAKTGNADADLTAAVDALIAGFGQGSDGSMELLYETAFTLEESQVGVMQTDVVTINTGFASGDSKSLYCITIECVNDTEEDVSFNHFKARIQFYLLEGGKYISCQRDSGICYSSQYNVYGANYGLFANSGTNYAETIVLRHTAHTTFGTAPSGDYRFRVYKMTPAFFGLEGISL